MTISLPPLVIGYPRTGFTLLISVISEVLTAGHVHRPGQNALKALCDQAGWKISEAIVQTFRKHAKDGDLIYNHNFRQMVGGPKWLKDDNPDVACFRKYLGVRGDGDFTLFTSHPREVLDYYEICHSHVAPKLWPTVSPYDRSPRFASVRHPVGTVTSACFSLNALASEYIQRFVPPEKDNDLLRQQLALYKLSDLNFFEALLAPFKSYMEEFRGVADQYFIMRWEDLIADPEKTISTVAGQLGLPIDKRAAAAIWAKLDHVNLTGAHKHNLRVGHGLVGGWKNWITNAHIALMREYGFDDVAVEFGYGKLEDLDVSRYTPFQVGLAEAIDRKEIVKAYDDEDLFGFAFNKSNLDLSRFSFKRYGWRDNTSIERSTCADDALVMDVWDTAERTSAIVNGAMTRWFAEGTNGSSNGRMALVKDLVAELAPLFDSRDEIASFEATMRRSVARDQVETETGESRGSPGHGETFTYDENPRLLKSVGKVNIVGFRGTFYALPQSLGPIDLTRQDATKLRGVKTADSLSELLQSISG